MMAGFDCTGGLWSVAAVTDSDCCYDEQSFVFSTVKTSGWISSRMAIVGDSAIDLKDSGPPKDIFEYCLEATGFSGRAYKDTAGRVWSVEAQAGLVFRRLKFECIRLSGKQLTGAVLAVPQGYRDPDKALLRAAWMADLEVNRIVVNRDAALLSAGKPTIGQRVLLVEWRDEGFSVSSAQWIDNSFRSRTEIDSSLSSRELIRALNGLICRKLTCAVQQREESRVLPKAERAAETLLDQSAHTISVETNEGSALIVLTQQEWVESCRELVGAGLRVIDRLILNGSESVNHIVLSGKWARFPGLRDALGKVCLAPVAPGTSEYSVARGAATMATEGDPIVNEFEAAADRFRSRAGYCYLVANGEINILFEPNTPLGARTQRPLAASLLPGQEIVLYSYEATPDVRLKLSSAKLHGNGPWTIRAELTAKQGVEADLVGKTEKVRLSSVSAPQRTSSGDADQRDWIRTMAIQ